MSGGDYHAERCPVCKGFGKVDWGKKTCHACGGRGIVFVPNRPGVPPWPGYQDAMMRDSDEKVKKT